MLQRAARNAYSWWWASHIRTKQSKWLEQNLQDMEEKVEYILKIINEDGDSFMVRAEHYYRKRPEIVNFVEDCFRGYRALAERYDYLSRELQNANRTIASVFPEQVQMLMDEEDFEEYKNSFGNDNPKTPKGLPLPDVPKPNPKPKVENVVQAVLKKKSKMPTRIMSKKGLIKLGLDENATKGSKTSGLSKSEALEEIDKLQKGILGLQTEKEFVKSSYENAQSKYWEIEEKVTEMQAKVNELQEEFGIGTVIEDNDARTLMSSTALKSCHETLAKLQEKQKRYQEEAKAENKRVEEAKKKLEALVEGKNNKPNSNLEEMAPEDAAGNDSKIQELLLESPKQEVLDQEGAENVEEKRARIREELLAKTEPITISELAEKIDELVDKVISLETEVTSQTALVTNLRSQTDELYAQIQNIEEDKEILVEGSKEKSEKIKKLEEELEKVQKLNKKVESKNEHLETSFQEASANLDHLSQNLSTAKPDEEMDEDVLFKEPRQQSPKFLKGEEEKTDRLDDHMTEENRRKGFNEHENSIALDENYSVEPQEGNIGNDSLMKNHGKAALTGYLERGFGEHEEVVPKDTDVEGREGANNITNRNNSSQEVPVEELLTEGGHQKELAKKVSFLLRDEDDQPNWRRIFSHGLEDREKMLLEEYASILKNYKEARKKLNEVEKKNRAYSFKSSVQIKVLRNSNASKDEEIRSLKEKLKLFLTGVDQSLESEPDKGPDLVNEERMEEFSDIKHKDKLEDADEDTKKLSIDEPPDEDIKKKSIDENPEVLGIEEKIRMDLDDLLEENIEFWLRFSTSYHQIKKFQDTFHDLLVEIKEVKERNRESGSGKHRESGSGKHRESGSGKHRHHRQSSLSLASDIRPLYRHLRDMQTELTLWLENNGILREDLQHRLSSLSNIQEEISALTDEGSKDEEKVAALTRLQAAKFQGEVLNMKQENAKVSDELRVAAERVKRLQIDIEKTLAQLDDEMGKNKNPASGSRIPLKSFLFGVKLRKHKPSFFACMSPSLQRQFSDLQSLPRS